MIRTPSWMSRGFITVRSIVGRFLEHSRIWHFENGGDPEIYLSSADLMERNLNKRVEVACPVDDADLRHYLRHVVLEAYLRDNVRSQLLRSDGTYQPVEGDSAPVDAQALLMNPRLRDLLANEGSGLKTQGSG